MLSITGLSLEQFAGLMQGLGYMAREETRPKRRSHPQVTEPEAQPDTPQASAPPEPAAAQPEPGARQAAAVDLQLNARPPDSPQPTRRSRMRPSPTFQCQISPMCPFPRLRSRPPGRSRTCRPRRDHRFPVRIGSPRGAGSAGGAGCADQRTRRCLLRPGGRSRCPSRRSLPSPPRRPPRPRTYYVFTRAPRQRPDRGRPERKPREEAPARAAKGQGPGARASGGVPKPRTSAGQWSPGEAGRRQCAPAAVPRSRLIPTARSPRSWR